MRTKRCPRNLTDDEREIWCDWDCATANTRRRERTKTDRARTDLRTILDTVSRLRRALVRKEIK